jgi:hypothetical protein
MMTRDLLDVLAVTLFAGCGGDGGGSEDGGLAEATVIRNQSPVVVCYSIDGTPGPYICPTPTPTPAEVEALRGRQ